MTLHFSEFSLRFILNVSQAAASALFDAYGGFDTLPNTTSDTFRHAGGVLFVESRALADGYGLHWTIMIAIPESDLAGTLFSSRKRVIGACVGVATGMLLFAGFVTFLITRPLRLLTRLMMEAAELDFRALHSGEIANQKPSRIWELSALEQTFERMLKRFADAVEKNRQLMRWTSRSLEKRKNNA
ncbi:hypothetical protein BDZ88DRAFT_215067 [Geranomyces variabilis]|nr:hypothetical protein BDZ88DRAFT_215067 [Geranomyces variabilis]KAJ3136257.1 hypothetical protein HDU90_003307 [Geranomyces variabilis]